QEGVERPLPEGALAAKPVRIKEAALVQQGQVEDVVADRDADVDVAAGMPKDAIGEVLNREMRLGRDRHAGTQPGAVGGVHHSLPAALAHEPEGTQVLARLVETATAEGSHAFPPCGLD